MIRDKRFVYLLKEQGANFYRVGSTRDINFREKSLRQGNPRKLELVHFEEFYDPKTVLAMERYVQRLLSKYTSNPSWYKIPSKDIKNIKEECRRIKKWYSSELNKHRTYGFEYFLKYQPKTS
jgi:predicted GIY-YIG superfamily endonuclease